MKLRLPYYDTNPCHSSEMGIDAAHNLTEWRNRQDANLESMQTVFDNICATLRRERNATLPIYSLPPEILSEIFKYSNSEDVFVISSVCSHWRAISLGCATLWSHITLLPGMVTRPLQRLLIERSASAPLHVHTRRADVFRRKEVFPIKPTALDRIWTICHLDDAEFDTIVPTMPELRSLRIITRRNVPIAHYGTAFPKLRHLSISRTKTNALQQGSITKDLYSLHINYSFEPLDVLEVASELPLLQELSVRGRVLQPPVSSISALRPIVGRGPESLKRMRLDEMDAYRIERFIQAMVYDETCVTMTVEQDVQNGFKIIPFESSGVIWVNKRSYRDFWISYARPKSIICVQPPMQRNIIIPPLVDLSKVHSLYINNFNYTYAVRLRPFSGLRLLVLDRALSFDETTVGGVASMLTADLARYSTYLEEIIIIIRRDSNDEDDDLSEVSSGSPSNSVENSEQSTSDESQDTSSDEMEEESEQSSENADPNQSTSSNDDSASGTDTSISDESEHPTHDQPIEDVIQDFLDAWMETHGRVFTRITIYDTIDPGRWERVLPVLSTKAYSVNLSIPSISITPPSFPQMRDFSSGCSICSED